MNFSFLGKKKEQGEITTFLVLSGLAVIVFGIIAGGKLVQVGPRELPKAACTGPLCAIPTPDPLAAATHPNCSGLTMTTGANSGANTVYLGDTASFTASYSSPQGNLGGEVLAGQAGTIVWAPGQQSITGNSGSLTFRWTPTTAGTYDIFCRAWNDAVAECRGNANYVDGPPRYACVGPDALMTVNVIKNPTCTIPPACVYSTPQCAVDLLPWAWMCPQGYCTADSNCTDTQNCVSNKCTDVACNTMADSCKKAVVQNHACQQVNLPDGTGCGDSTTGATCQNGLCVPKPTVTPTPGASSTHCIPETYTHGTCTGECAFNGWTCVGAFEDQNGCVQTPDSSCDVQATHCLCASAPLSPTPTPAAAVTVTPKPTVAVTATPSPSCILPPPCFYSTPRCLLMPNINYCPPVITPVPVPTCNDKNTGDANCDGKVDGQDYSLWLNSQCHPSPSQACASLSADYNGDKKVDDADYKIWFGHRK